MRTASYHVLTPVNGKLESVATTKALSLARAILETFPAQSEVRYNGSIIFLRSGKGIIDLRANGETQEANAEG